METLVELYTIHRGYILYKFKALFPPKIQHSFKYYITLLELNHMPRIYITSVDRSLSNFIRDIIK
jgi:hypothetical protein